MITFYDEIRHRQPVDDTGMDHHESTLKRDLLLHPIRLRIVQALVNLPMTTGQLMDVLGDIAQATLYRHIKALETGGLLEVTDERRVRGVVERTYSVVESAVSLTSDDLVGVERDEHLRFFATFTGTLLSDYAAYLEAADLETDAIDLEADRVGYRQVALWLNDAEFDELAAELCSTVRKRLDIEPGAGRRRRLVTTIVMPDDRSRPSASPTQSNDNGTGEHHRD